MVFLRKTYDLQSNLLQNIDFPYENEAFDNCFIGFSKENNGFESQASQLTSHQPAEQKVPGKRKKRNPGQTIKILGFP